MFWQLLIATKALKESGKKLEQVSNNLDQSYKRMLTIVGMFSLKTREEEKELGPF